MSEEFIKKYMDEAAWIAHSLPTHKILEAIEILKHLHGRVFVLGVGGSAANASHMVNDLRKLCRIEAYCPTDNVAELTANINDHGFDQSFIRYLASAKFCNKDVLIVLSVGGGSIERNISVNIIQAIQHAKSKNAKVISIVGKHDGFAANNSDVAIVIPMANFYERITPHAESFQSVIQHCIISHPDIQKVETTW